MNANDTNALQLVNSASRPGRTPYRVVTMNPRLETEPTTYDLEYTDPDGDITQIVNFGQEKTAAAWTAQELNARTTTAQNTERDICLALAALENGDLPPSARIEMAKSLLRGDRDARLCNL